MNLLVYIAERLFFSIKSFLSRWYLSSFRYLGHLAVSSLERFDRVIAFRTNFQHLFSPLFQDRSIVGYLLGFFSRAIRLLFGGVFYLFIILFFFVVYLIWAAIPFGLLYFVFVG